MQRTDDLRIRTVRPLIPPAILAEEVPLSEAAAEVVTLRRREIGAILKGEDRRLLVVVGPCSIHDADAAREYASKLAELAPRYDGRLLLAIRAYFEKPRTVTGWKGLINDPDLDESFRINKGLRLARALLLEFAEMGLAAATEFLDTSLPQYTADLVAWGAIGARTTESQLHRELASGLSMPVGFKNTTDGEVRAAVDAIVAARSRHWFPSVTKQGVAAISETTGNDTCHLVLRGGSKTGPNYSAEHVARAAEMLRARGVCDRVMIDCSHGNSLKDPARQGAVAADVASQIRDGSRSVMGVMLESNLVGGRQEVVAGKPLTYGQSITDACLGWNETVPILDNLAEAVG
ncbi:MAG: 3-deoxy-7-phosphoheptulonate synthase [Fimbriimonadaceae bacterium]